MYITLQSWTYTLPYNRGQFFSLNELKYKSFKNLVFYFKYFRIIYLGQFCLFFLVQSTVFMTNDIILIEFVWIYVLLRNFTTCDYDNVTSFNDIKVLMVNFHNYNPLYKSTYIRTNIHRALCNKFKYYEYVRLRPPSASILKQNHLSYITNYMVQCILHFMILYKLDVELKVKLFYCQFWQYLFLCFFFFLVHCTTFFLGVCWAVEWWYAYVRTYPNINDHH